MAPSSPPPCSARRPPRSLPALVAEVRGPCPDPLPRRPHLPPRRPRPLAGFPRPCRRGRRLLPPGHRRVVPARLPGARCSPSCSPGPSQRLPSCWGSSPVAPGSGEQRAASVAAGGTARGPRCSPRGPRSTGSSPGPGRRVRLTEQPPPTPVPWAVGFPRTLPQTSPGWPRRPTRSSSRPSPPHPAALPRWSRRPVGSGPSWCPAAVAVRACASQHLAGRLRAAVRRALRRRPSTASPLSSA